MKVVWRTGALFTAAALVAQPLTQAELDMFHDAAGWEYIEVSDADKGVQTEHTCFDGQPHEDQCKGTLTFSDDRSFAQDIKIHGQSVQRHGTYTLDSDQLTFVDELGTKDGPYAVTVNRDKKTLVLQGERGGTQARMSLLLESEYCDRLRKQKEKKAAGQ